LARLNLDSIPVGSVATEVQCEIYEFLDSEGKAGTRLLDPNQAASVTLILQTDLQGYVQYVGINLAKLGFTSLGQLVTATNNTPSLQAKGAVHSTLSAEVDFNVAQSESAPPIAPNTPPPMLIKQTDMGQHYQNSKFTSISSNPPTFQAVQQPPGPASSYYFLPRSACDQRPLIQRAYLALWLQDWLTRFKAQVQKQPPFVCNTKVTLKTQFEIAADVSAGVNPLMVSPIILPISGLNVDGNPDWQHTLQISFALKDTSPLKGHASYCSVLKGAQPTVVNH
jgi:hypothetical protein